MKKFDAIIIGAGQAGPAPAGKLTGAGMTVAFVERKLFVRRAGARRAHPSDGLRTHPDNAERTSSGRYVRNTWE